MNTSDIEGTGPASSQIMARAWRGLAAWARGDVSALADLLDPEVQLLWWSPGDWDCHGREAVLALLAERAEQGPPAEVDLTDMTERLGEPAVLVERRNAVLGGPEAGLRPATVVRFRDGLVVSMQQYRSRGDAVADASIS